MTTARTLRIVVVDDDLDMLEAVSRNLELDGHRVIRASDGREALDLIASERPDLVVADIRMPNMDGDEMFRILREEQGDLAVIPFIFLSGNVNESDRINRLNIGADLCLGKPIRMPLLRAHVNSCLARSKRHADFMTRKLDAISNKIPGAAEHSFTPFKSLFTNLSDYVEVLVGSIEQLGFENAAGTSEKRDDVLQPLAYVRFCLSQLERRRQLVRSLSSDALTWWLIFSIAEAQFAKEEIFVSDLYVSAPSAKTTINSRINMLVDESVIEKSYHVDDGRRQKMTLSANFERILLENIETSVGMIKNVISAEP